PRRKAHAAPDGFRQFARPERFGGAPVPGFFPLDALDHRPRPGVAAFEPFDVSLQMLLDLPLGLGEKSEIPALAQSPGGITESQRTRIPQGIEQALASAELAYAVSAPSEMIGLFARRLCERVLDIEVRRRQRLTLVK